MWGADYNEESTLSPDKIPTVCEDSQMTLLLDLTPELEQRLTQEARRYGISPDEYTVQLLEKHLPPKEFRSALVTLLQSWIDADDAEEQKETGEYLVRVLDEDRLSDRKLFPPELKGVTW